jgi:50S ribosomal subunit-associated GTPase HflX
VFNKSDLAGPADLNRLRAEHPDAQFVSAVSGLGLDGLKTALRERALGAGHKPAAHEKWAAPVEDA